MPSAEDSRQWGIKERIALVAVSLTAIGVLTGGVTALFGGGYFFATITSEVKSVGDDVAEIKGDVKMLKNDVDKRLNELDRAIEGVDDRVRILEIEGGE